MAFDWVLVKLVFLLQSCDVSDSVKQKAGRAMRALPGLEYAHIFLFNHVVPVAQKLLGYGDDLETSHLTTTLTIAEWYQREADKRNSMEQITLKQEESNAVEVLSSLGNLVRTTDTTGVQSNTIMPSTAMNLVDEQQVSNTIDYVLQRDEH